MAPHSSTLAWKIPRTEEPGRLQSMGSLRVGHDWATSLSLFTSCIGGGNGNPLQCSCLENPRDGGAWWAAVYGVTQSRTWLTRLSSSSSSSSSSSIDTLSLCLQITEISSHFRNSNSILFLFALISHLSFTCCTVILKLFPCQGQQWNHLVLGSKINHRHSFHWGRGKYGYCWLCRHQQKALIWALGVY